MRVLTFDVETTHRDKPSGGTTALPHFGNRLVSVGFKWLGNDVQWVRSCNFTYEGHVYDTMVAEYLLAKARRWPLGLAALAQKYGGIQKEKDLVQPYLKDGKTFYEIPWEIVEEYGIADVAATEHVALKQLEAFGTTFEELYGKRTDTDTEAVA